MRGFSLFLSAMVLMAGSTFARAEKPRQAPTAMSEQEIKDYIDAQVDAAVQKALSRQAAPSSAVYSSPAYGRAAYQACPAGASCPDGCVDYGDGTCSCPAGTSCGMSQYGSSACGSGGCGSGGCGSSACGSGGGGRRFFGRRHR